MVIERFASCQSVTTFTSCQSFRFSLAAKTPPGRVDTSVNSFILSCCLSFLVWDVIHNSASIPWFHRGQEGYQVRDWGVVFLGWF